MKGTSFLASLDMRSVRSERGKQ